MLGLYGSGMTFIGQLGLGAVFSILTAALGAVTLVPAGLALAGRRIDRWSLRNPVAESGSSSDGWHHYAAPSDATRGATWCSGSAPSP